MSSYDNAQQPESEDDFLSPDERTSVRRLLKFPEEFPRDFGAWMIDYMGTNGFFQKSQVQGLPLLNSQVQDALDTLETTVETLSVIGTTYSAENPSQSISEANNYSPAVVVPAGTYFCICSGTGEITSGAGVLSMQMYNSDAAAAFGSVGTFSELSVNPSPGDGPFHALISIGSTTLSSEGTISMRGIESGNGNRFIYNAALVALRTG